MFGQSSTPFGGGGFGQQPTNNNTQGSLFGSPQPAFGAFGSPAPAPSGFGGVGAFGAPAAPTNTFGAPTTNTFGSPAPAPGGFGVGAFGAPTSTFGSPPATGFGVSTFGAPAAPTNTFGAPVAQTNTFGSSNATGGSLFGQPATTGGGLFSQAPAPSAFGAPAPSAFGGGGGLFGSTSTTSTFGAPTSQFGSQPPAPVFGAPPVGGLFQSTPAPAPSLFGSTPSTGAFGAPTSGSLFGSTAPAPSGGGSGTLIAPYQASSRVDGTATINLQSISAMEQYKDQSHEELRFADYSQGNRGTSTPAPAAFGGFGAATAPIGATGSSFGGSSLFGNAPAPTGGLFGSPPAPSGGLFGSTTPAPAPFGAPAQAPAAGSLFGAAPAPTSAFGGSTLFGGTPAPTGGLFGSTPAPSVGLFGGSTPAPAPFGAPAPAGGGLFGSTPAAPSAFGGSSLFGSSPAPTGGLFGTAAAPSGGLFGSTPAPAPFGAPTQPPSSGGFFGSAPAAPSAFGGSSLFAPAQFGAPNTFGAQQPPLQQQPFQTQAQPLQVQTMFNAPIVAAGVSEVLEQQMRALSNQLDENKKLEVWRGPRASTSPASTPTSNHRPTQFFPRNSQFEGLSYTTPRPTTDIRPRGFAQSEPGKSTLMATTSRRDNRALMSPEAFARSSQLNLVVRPDSLRRSNKLSLQRPSKDTATIPSLPEPSIDPIPAEPPIDDNSKESTKGSNGETPHQDHGKPNLAQLIEAPAKSSSYEYYQQVIGNSHSGSNLPVTPMPNGTSNGRQWYIPKLTKAGYEVSPSISELSCMSEADLASVRNFSVWRPGYGKVEWEGSVDVRGANLDDIVVIESKDVSVYNLDEENGTKPDEGTKLNRPALITFEQVFPKGGPLASEEAKNRFTMKLKAAAKSMNSEFVSHNSKTGIWKIRVRHFSRYALVDDDDSDDDIGTSDTKANISTTPAPIRKVTEKRKATPFATSRVKFADVTEDDGDFTNKTMVLEKINRKMDRVQADNAARSIQEALLEKENFSSPLITAETELKVNLEDEDYDLEDNFYDDCDLQVVAKCVMEKQITNQDYLKAAHGKSFCSEILGLCKSNDSVSANANRSFRVGWLPNGTFLRLTSSPAELVVSHPVLFDDSNKKVSVALLQSQRNNAVAHPIDESGCSLYTLSRDVRQVVSLIPDSDESKQAFQLLSRLFPLKRAASSFVLYDEQVPPKDRDVAAVLRLLVNLCDINDSTSCGNSDSHVTAKLLEAFSLGNAERAKYLSNGSGSTPLELLLASNPTYNDDFSLHLNKFKQTRGLNNDVNSDVLRALRNLGGDMNLINFAYNSEEKSFDWCHRLVLRILQRPNDTLLELLDAYEDSWVANEEPYPYPSYLIGTDSTDVQSLFYRLLRICANPAVMTVCEAIDPNGYTPYHHDFYLPFHLASTLTLVSGHAFKLCNHDAEYIKDGYIAQLVMQGCWESAVFVALCCIGEKGDTESRDLVRQQGRYHHCIRRAKNLILQYYNKHDPLAEQRRHYLIETIGIPSIWFDETMCYRSAVVDNDLIGYMDHMKHFNIDMWRDSCILFLSPNVLVSSSSMVDAMTDLATDALPNSLAMALFRYVEFENKFSSYRNKKMVSPFECSDVDFSELEVFRDNLDYLYKYFLPLYEGGHECSNNHSGTNSFYLPILSFCSDDAKIPFTSMVSEIVKNICQWKKELMF